METVRIKLSRPITVPGDAAAIEVSEIVLREPMYSDIMALGEPSLFARDGSGMIYTAEKDDVVKSYVERLLIEPKNPVHLSQLCARDTFKVRDAVHDFFNDARSATT